ncbi:hypothetical protein F5141DRAFT_1187370 [Pisolithus sp. B1]|nr:hypothetical protein F5141DRAFT_1187370 [Pisolithus sp. B1]
MLHRKPTDLRHKCLFYIGHIPTFLDMFMSRALHEPNTEPKNFTLIFDHYHAFQNGNHKRNRRFARMLAITKHEGWHVATLLYMLIQRAGTGALPPPGTSTVTVGPARVTLGYDDCESEDFSPDVAGIVDVHAFGWGNESLTCFEEVKQVKIERKPVTNAGFLTICKGNKQVGLPVSWMEDTGEIKFSIAFRASIRTVYGSVSMGRLGGRGSDGGIEWTSTLFSNHEGLFPYRPFPWVSRTRNTSLPSDQRHNFYQHNYPYAWVGARIVYDIHDV